ncbi:hypothetical protein QUF70_16230, partial [Desulfobacterales bacterium HSG17]|nr:hypothetical protein [Desulfobacterales bacterium HSG17]
MKKTIKTLSIIVALMAILMFAGCSSSSSSVQEEPDVSFYGQVIDGPIKNIFVFADLNGNGTWEDGEEPYAWTNGNGNFHLKGKKSKGFKKGVVVIALGASDAIDITTGIAVTGILKSIMDEPKENPSEAITIVLSALTTLAVEIGEDVVKTNLNIQGDYNIFTFNSFVVINDANATSEQTQLAINIQAITVKILNIVETITSTIIGSEDEDCGSKGCDSTSGDSKSTKDKKKKHDVFSIAMIQLSTEITKADFKVEHFENSSTIVNIIDTVITEVSTQQIFIVNVERINVVKTTVVNQVVEVNNQVNTTVNTSGGTAANIMTNMAAITIVINNASTNVQNATSTGSQEAIQIIVNNTTNISTQ